MPQEPKRALIFVADGSEEIESIAPGDVLVRCGVDVTYAGVDTLTPDGSRGLPLRADVLVQDISGQAFDAVVLPGGGPGARNLAASETVNGIVLAHHRRGALVCAICAAPAAVLAPLGVLDGRRATCYPGHEDAFRARAEYVADEDVVVDGNVVTSRGPGTAIAFGLAIALLLTGDRDAVETARNGLLIRA